MVSDSDLDKAIEDVKDLPDEGIIPEEPETPPEEPPEDPPEEPEEPETPPEEPPAEPDDNAERSKLGRKVKSLEERLEQALSTIDMLKAGKPEDDTTDPDDVVTVGEIDKILEKKEAEKQANLRAYQTSYYAEFGALGLDLDEDVHMQIAQDAEKNYVQQSKDPKLDAKLNFAMSKARYFEGLATQVKKNPLEKNRGKAPEKLDTPSATHVAPKEAQPVKLDGHASAYAKYLGYSAEEVEKILSSEAPLSITQR